MASQRSSTKYLGVYERLVIHRVSGKQDIAFDIAYRHGGKKVWETIGRKSEGVNAAYAARVRAERVKEVEAGRFIARDEMPVFRDALERYLTVHAKGKSSESHMRGYFEHHIAPLFGDTKMDRIKPIHIEELKRSMSEKGLSPQTIRHAIALVRQVYRKCVAWGIYTGTSPTDGVEMPKVDAARLRFLTEAEAASLLHALHRRSRQWHDIAYLSLYTGMRLGEVLGLQVGHVNVADGVIDVMDAKAGTRAAYMTAGVKEILAARCAGRDAKEFVFVQRGGGRVRYISSVFSRVADELFNDGVTDARHKVVFHTLRHTFGSWLAQRGVPLYTIAVLMGHSSLEMTKRYSKLSPDTKHDAMALLPELPTSPADDAC